jgi:hypothetical protein
MQKGKIHERVNICTSSGVLPCYPNDEKLMISAVQHMIFILSMDISDKNILSNLGSKRILATLGEAFSRHIEGNYKKWRM